MGQRPDRIVYPALAIALGGMAVILVAGLLGADRLSMVGVACGVATGLLYAALRADHEAADADGAQHHDRSRARWRSTPSSCCRSPSWQVSSSDYQLTRDDIVVALVLGVLCTAIPYVLYPEGLRRVRVEHASILGFLEPVSAPLYALLLLGEAPATATIAGGALIVVAGVLVVVFGAGETLAEPGHEAPPRSSLQLTATRQRRRGGRRADARWRREGAMRSRPAQGYALVASSFVIMGLIGALVAWASAPESALLVMRFVTAGLVLGVGLRPAPAAGRRARPRRLAAPPPHGLPRRGLPAALLHRDALRRASRSACSCSSWRRSGSRSPRRASSDARRTASSTRRLGWRSAASL